jgi:hypothetical protein
MGSVSKMLELIGYKKNYCIFVSIFEKAVSDLIPFLISFFVFVLIFSVVIIFMNGDLDVEDDSEYLGISFIL